MANSGGGVIVFGVAETEKKATERCDTGILSENHERSLQQVAVSGISPPVFGLDFIRIGEDGNRAVVVVVPPSIDGPHLIFRNEYFGAPVRNNADTVWMREREISTQYRLRFEAARHATEVLDKLYAEAAAGHDTKQRAWLIAVAHPRVTPTPVDRWSREDAKIVYDEAGHLSLSYAPNLTSFRPLGFVAGSGLRSGLRRWIAQHSTPPLGDARVFGTSVSVHFDGSVTVAATVSAHKATNRSADEFDGGWKILSPVVEGCVADLMALIRAAGERMGAVDYEIRIGIEWESEDPMVFLYKEGRIDIDTDIGLAVYHYAPVEATVEVRDDDGGYLQQVREVAGDVISQGGFTDLSLIKQGLV